jgi:DNA-binding response OmpR family regulator
VPKVLIIEDDPKIVEAIQKTFSLEPGFTCRSTSQPDRVIDEAIAYKPDLILLDIKLPGGDGRQIIRTLKENSKLKLTPIIFLTGMSNEGDRVLGLNLGADDYVVKPFGAMELLARIQAVLRRTQRAASNLQEDVVHLSGLTLDRSNRVATWRGKRLKLQPKEFEVLYLLASRPDRTLTREFLVESTSRYEADVASRSLDTHIKNLRQKLGPPGQWIETVPKLGYRLNSPA